MLRGGWLLGKAEGLGAGALGEVVKVGERCGGGRGSQGCRGGDGLQSRDHVEAKGAAEARGVGVGGIALEIPVGGGADSLGLGAGEAEKRAHQDNIAAEGKPRCDSGEAASAGAADEAHQERFELVVGVMGGGDEGAVVTPRQGGECAVAGDAGIGFEIAGSGANADSGLGEGKAEVAGEFGRGITVGAGLAGWAQVVKDVGNNEVVGRGGEGQNKGGRIGATGTGDQGSAGIIADRAATGEFPPGGDGAGDARSSSRRGSDERALLHGPMIRCILRPEVRERFRAGTTTERRWNSRPGRPDR